MADRSDAAEEKEKEKDSGSSAETQASEKFSSEVQSELFSRTSSDSKRSNHSNDSNNASIFHNEQNDRTMKNAGFPSLELVDSAKDGRSNQSKGEEKSAGSAADSNESQKDSGPAEIVFGEEERAIGLPEPPIDPATDQALEPPADPDLLTGSPYFRDGNVIGMNDPDPLHKDNSDEFHEKFAKMLDTLENDGLSDVALEGIPSSLNETIQEYAEAKRKYKEAEERGASREELDNLQKERDRLREKIKKSLEEFHLGESFSPERIMKMIDAAHSRGLRVNGLEPDTRRMVDIFSGVRDSGDESVQRAYVDFYREGATSEEREAAREKLMDYFKKKYGDTPEGRSRAEADIRTMEKARAQGFGLPPNSQFSDTRGDIRGTIAFMNWRDSHFASQFQQLNSSGRRTLAFAGDLHFSNWPSEFKDRLGRSTGDNEDLLRHWRSARERFPSLRVIKN